MNEILAEYQGLTKNIHVSPIKTNSRLLYSKYFKIIRKPTNIDITQKMIRTIPLAKSKVEIAILYFEFFVSK